MSDKKAADCRCDWGVAIDTEFTGPCPPPHQVTSYGLCLLNLKDLKIVDQKHVGHFPLEPGRGWCVETQKWWLDQPRMASIARKIDSTIPSKDDDDHTAGDDSKSEMKERTTNETKVDEIKTKRVTEMESVSRATEEEEEEKKITLMSLKEGTAQFVDIIFKVASSLRSGKEGELVFFDGYSRY